MYLFSKEKEIIFKITNAILLIWFIAAIVVMFTTIISLLVKDPSENYSYDEYKTVYCGYYDETSTEFKESCENEYNSYKLNNKSSNYNKLMTIYGSAVNIIIVGGVLYFLNKEKDIKKKK